MLSEPAARKPEPGVLPLCLPEPERADGIPRDVLGHVSSPCCKLGIRQTAGLSVPLRTMCVSKSIQVSVTLPKLDVQFFGISVVFPLS